jgi:hypothetical protein
MLTRAKLKAGEGKINTFNLEIGRETQEMKMDDEERCAKHDNNFHKIFYQISYMVETLYADYEEIVEKKEKKKKSKGEDSALVNHGIGGDPPKPPSPY